MKNYTLNNTCWCFILYLLATTCLKAQTKVIGYLPYYQFHTADQIEFDKLTHLYLAFANPNLEGNLSMEGYNMKPVVEMAHSKNVDVFISLGGRLLDDWWIAWQHLLHPLNRSTFIHKIVNYTLDHNLQGVDIDLEWNHVNKNYSGFVLELRDSLHQYGLNMTAALPAIYRYPQITDKALVAFDWINIMAYDFTGPWDASKPGQHSPIWFAIKSIDYWQAQGVEKERLLLGIPFYGWNFNNKKEITSMPFGEIVAKNPDYAPLNRIGHIYYNGISNIVAKTKLAKEKVGGIMIWHLAQDAFNEFSLLNKIHETLKEDDLLVVEEPELKIEPKEVIKESIPELRVYPNPFKDWLHVQPTLNSMTQVILVDVHGREVLRKTFAERGVISLGTSGVPKGFYCLKIVHEGKVISRKLIKT